MGKIKLEMRQAGVWDETDMCFSNDLGLRSKSSPKALQPQGRKAKTRSRRQVARGWMPGLLRLPSEIRMRIFEYAITEAFVEFQTIPGKEAGPVKLEAKLICPDGEGVLFACKKFNAECRPALRAAVKLTLCRIFHLGQVSKFVTCHYWSKLRKVALMVPRPVLSYFLLEDFESLEEPTLIHAGDHHVVIDWYMFYAFHEMYHPALDWALRAASKRLPFLEDESKDHEEFLTEQSRRFKVLHEFKVMEVASARRWRWYQHNEMVSP